MNCSAVLDDGLALKELTTNNVTARVALVVEDDPLLQRGDGQAAGEGQV
jgi:hypothetical protein